LAGPTGGTVTPPLQSLTSAHSWQIANSAQLNASARVNLLFGPDDNIGTLANARVAQAATPAGHVRQPGATTTGTSSAGTVESTANLTPGFGLVRHREHRGAGGNLGWRGRHRQLG
jgi:hypothetical protein